MFHKEPEQKKIAEKSDTSNTSRFNYNKIGNNSRIEYFPGYKDFNNGAVTKSSVCDSELGKVAQPKEYRESIEEQPIFETHISNAWCRGLGHAFLGIRFNCLDDQKDKVSRNYIRVGFGNGDPSRLMDHSAEASTISTSTHITYEQVGELLDNDIVQTQKKHKYNLLTYNCNKFVSDIASQLGFRNISDFHNQILPIATSKKLSKEKLNQNLGIFATTKLDGAIADGGAINVDFISSEDLKLIIDKCKLGKDLKKSVEDIVKILNSIKTFIGYDAQKSVYQQDIVAMSANVVRLIKKAVSESDNDDLNQKLISKINLMQYIADSYSYAQILDNKCYFILDPKNGQKINFID